MHGASLPQVFRRALVGLVCALAPACASQPDGSATRFEIRVVGARSAIEDSTFVLSPAPTRFGNPGPDGNRWAQDFGYDVTPEDLLGGLTVALWTLRDDVTAGSVSLTPYVCALAGSWREAGVTTEMHEVEIDAAGNLWLDTDFSRALSYQCETVSQSGSDGEGSAAFEAAPPRCDSTDRVGTDVRFQLGEDDASPASLCRAMHVLRDAETLHVELVGNLNDGRSLGVAVAICASPADVPLERDVAHLTDGCTREGIDATLADVRNAQSVDLVPRSGNLVLEAIEDARDGRLSGSIDLVLESGDGESFRVSGPFVLPTLRIDARP